MTSVSIDGVTDPESDPVTVSVVCINQDEPLNENGDGSTEIDAQGVGQSAALLRAERQGGGDGRVYHIGFSATDISGAQCRGEVRVDVRHNRKTPAIDGGSLFSSTGAATTDCGTSQNLPPIFSSEPVLQGKEGENYQYQLSVSDADGDVITLQLLQAPVGMTLNSGLVNWLPTFEQSGEHTVVLEASDANHRVEQTFTIAVDDTNRAPEIMSHPLTTAQEGSSYNYQILAKDADDDDLDYALLTGPQGIGISNEGLLSWDLDFNSSGIYQIGVSVTDGNEIVTQEFSLVIANTNRAPVFESSPLLAVNEGELYSYRLQASDADSDLLAITLISGPSGMFLDQDLLSWSPGYDQAGTHQVVLAVTDGDATTEQNFLVAVTDINRVPYFSSQPISSAIEGEAYLYRLAVEDDDGDALQLSLTSAPLGLVLDPTSDSLEWTQPVAGDFAVVVSADDGRGAIVEQSFTLNVVQLPPSVSAEGTEFWLMFNTIFAPLASKTLQVTGVPGTEFSVEIPLADVNINDIIPSGGVRNVQLFDFRSVIQSEEFGVNENGIRVRSEEKIQVRLLHRVEQATDSALLFPVESLGSSYVAVSYNKKELLSNTEFSYGNFIGVVATEDFTTVTITPTATLSEKPTSEQRVRGVPYQVILNAGETYQAFRVDADADVSGTQIQSDKPVAAFSGDRCAAVGAYFCDHLVEQLIPVRSQGNHFLTMPLATRKNGDIFRVVATENNTHVWIGGDLGAFLNAGDFHQLELDSPTEISSDKPITLMQFAQGHNHDANQTGLPYGYSDPLMMTVPSIEQFNRQVHFVTPETYPDFNYLNIIAPTYGLEGVTLDGVVVAPSYWQPIPDSDFSGAQIPIAAGKHDVVSDVLIGSTLYGWEYFESYGALGALTLNDGRAASQLVINGASEIPIGEQACWQIRALDEESVPVNQAQLFVTRIASDVQRTFMRMTDEKGSAQFCYTGLRAGEETLVFRMGDSYAQTEQQRDVRWLQAGSEQNRAPQIVNLPPMYATPGLSYTHQTIAHDADLDRINFLLTEHPPGMTIDENTGFIEWDTPRDFDSTWITIIADDGRGGLDKQRYWLRFARGSNRYPAFTSEPVTRAVAGRLYRYQMSGFDRDRDSFVFQLIDGPEGMQVNGQNLEWTPTLANLGHHLVEVRIQDVNGDGENRLFTLNVEANLDPAFISAPPVTGVVGHEYLYFFDAVDGNADALTYSLPQAPTGMQLVAVGTTRYLRWTPQTGQGGEVPLVLRADDNFGGVTDQVFIISVEENAAPEFTSTPPPSAVSGHTYFYTPQTFDSNGDTVVLALTSAPTGASIAGGVMRWTPTLEQVGTHSITVRAEDNRGGWATQTFTLTVAINSPPVVTSVPPVSATVGHRLVYLPKATDAEGDFSTFSLLSGPLGMSMFANQLSWVPESGQVGPQTVTVAASDGKGGTSTQVFTLQVAENASPLFTTAPFSGAKVGTRYGYTMRAVDADGDGVLYRLVEGPVGASVSLTGQLWWIPQATQSGDHPFIVEAYDNYSGVTQQAFTLRVISDALQIVGVPDGALLYNDEAFVAQVQALHPNNLSVTYSLDQSPAGVTLDAISGQLVWTPTEDQIGMHQISVSADSADGQHDSATFALEVARNTNQAPVFTSTAITSARAGDDYLYQVMAQDPQGHAINYSLTQSPVLMTIDAHSGLLSWSPLEINVGTYDITVRATDERGKFSEQTFTLNVSFANRKPQVSGASANQAVVDYLYQSLLPVTDPDGDALTFSAYSVPVGVSVDALTGLVSWTPTADQIGQQVLEVLVSDGEHSIVVGWHVTVLAEPLPLEITAQVTPQFVQPDESAALQLQITGAVTTPEVVVTLDGEAVALDDAFSASLSSPMPGRHEIAVSVNDGVRVATTNTYFSVADVDDQAAPEVVIHTPLGGSRITAPTDIRVTVRDANIADVILALRRPGAAEHSYKELYRGTTTFDDEVIATFDPTMLRNGMYNLILQATDINGQQSSSAIPVIVEGGLKVGLFSMTIEDLSLPMAGIPVRVTRTYDSRERQEFGDFGFGWRVDYQNARVDESSEPTESWYQETRNLQFKFEDTQVIAPGTCTYARASKLVTVTLPNDDVEKFQVHAQPVNGSPASVSDPDCHFLADRYFDLQFEPIGDTDSTLEAESSESLFLTDTTDGNLSYIGETAPVQIVRYRLTTRQGYVYHLNQAFGIEKIVDPNGTTLTYSENGIEHSDGLSVVFTRGENGRIETIQDPAGNIYQYLYSDDGDLLTMEDPLMHRSEYRYNTNHGLVDIVDGLGRRLLRNLYDQDGRLTAQEDSDGNRLEFNHDLAGRQSVVTNRRGYSTVFNYDDRGNVLSRVNAHGKASHFTYDENDNQLSETDALGHQRKATFNERSDQLSATDALGH
ncbi:MAG: putative Ig domain-containing protein, partial [Alcanivoracaceae bacterium]|nr:putative Ig domain-containing protein [Alcanivoracaceae bacterium]